MALLRNSSLRNSSLLLLASIAAVLAACAISRQPSAAPTPAPALSQSPGRDEGTAEAPAAVAPPTEAAASTATPAVPATTSAPAFPPAAYPTSAAAPALERWQTLPVVPDATQTARRMYQLGRELGNDPRAFSKIGDCLSTQPLFLTGFDSPRDYRLGSNYSYLAPTIENFLGSFARESMAAHNGMNAASALNPIWADPSVCNSNESPLACEYRLHRPSFAFISLGTNGDWLSGEKYEYYMRLIIEQTMARGIVPILATKADNVEGDDRFNRIMAELAAEYDLPLWNFWRTSRDLPAFGIADDVYHLTWAPLNFDDAASMQAGWVMRNLTALQSLDSVWRGVTAANAPTDRDSESSNAPTNTGH